MGLTPKEKQRIQQWNEGLRRDVTLQLVTTEDKRSSKFEHFCDMLCGLAPCVRLTREKEASEEPPVLAVGPRLEYHALPMGHELDPFLAALSQGPAEPAQLTRPVQEAVAAITLPVFVKLFVTNHCPQCPETVRRLIRFHNASEQIYVTVIDGGLFPDIAAQYGVRSAPTVLLDNQFRWTGPVPLEELAHLAAKRDPSRLGATSLENMIKDGKAFDLARIMLEHKQIFPALLDLLVHEKIFVRLGAIVVLETIAAEDPCLAGQVVDPLWSRFPDAPDPIKGDILYVMGTSGARHAVPMLKAVLDGSFEEPVKEAALEALEALEPTS
ncbi:MAG: thioredoxin family protein [Deltaproteobacteria bacterium]|nr:thioredoxin family protein [Deltaproteobacteria bacterium]